MATAATDRSIKIWDIRKLHGPVQSYRTRASANNLAFSEKSLLGVAMGNIVEVYRYDFVSYSHSYYKTTK